MYGFIVKKYISILLKPFFKGFCWGISTIFHRVYLTYIPSHGMLIHLKDLTVNICISCKVSMYIKSKLLKSLQVSGNIKSKILWGDRKQLNLTCTHRISLMLTLSLCFMISRISYSWGIWLIHILYKINIDEE